MKKIETDKVFHFVAGATIYIMVSWVLLFVFFNERALAYGLGALAVLAAGIGKELCDGWDKADQWDFAATILGGAFGALIMGLAEVM